MREKNKYGFIPIFMSCLVLWSTNTGNDLMTWSSLVGEQKLLLKVTQCDNNMLAGKGAGNNA